jgi:tRNA threonylcarbamoyladenosine biosynthesis protein TsaE
VVASEIRIITKSPEETEALGARIGAVLRERGAGATVCLSGDLGAGKTVFVKGFAAAFGIPPRDVCSASFVLIAEYETVPRLVHVDLYRIEGAADLDELGIWEYIGPDTVTIIEWAERLSERPDDVLTISLAIRSEQEREIIIRDETNRYHLQATAS